MDAYPVEEFLDNPEAAQKVIDAMLGGDFKNYEEPNMTQEIIIHLREKDVFQRDMYARNTRGITVVADVDHDAELIDFRWALQHPNDMYDKKEGVSQARSKELVFTGKLEEGVPYKYQFLNAVSEMMHDVAYRNSLGLDQLDTDIFITTSFIAVVEIGKSQGWFDFDNIANLPNLHPMILGYDNLEFEMSNQIKITVVDDRMANAAERLAVSFSLNIPEKRAKKEKPKGGTIDEWFLSGSVIRGVLNGDPKNRGFDRRPHFQTSYVVWYSYDPETKTGVAETRNTIYNLGERSKFMGEPVYKLVYTADDEPEPVDCFIDPIFKDKAIEFAFGQPLAKTYEENLNILEKTRKELAKSNPDCNYKIVLEDYVDESKASNS